MWNTLLIAQQLQKKNLAIVNVEQSINSTTTAKTELSAVNTLATRMMLLMLLLLLPDVGCKFGHTKCETKHVLLTVPKYYEPGDYIYGGIIYQTAFYMNPYKFNQYPSGPPLGKMFV